MVEGRRVVAARSASLISQCIFFWYNFESTHSDRVLSSTFSSSPFIATKAERSVLPVISTGFRFRRREGEQGLSSVTPASFLFHPSLRPDPHTFILKYHPPFSPLIIPHACSRLLVYISAAGAGAGPAAAPGSFWMGRKSLNSGGSSSSE